MINFHWEGVILAGNVFIIYIKTIRILRIFRREGDYSAGRGSECTHLYTELWSTAGTQTIDVMMPVICQYDARDMSFCFTFQACSQGKGHQSVY